MQSYTRYVSYFVHLSRLAILDESTRVVRQSSGAPTRAPSVSGIGNLGEHAG